MKALKQFFEALLELIFLTITSVFTIVRWLWRKFKNWWKKRRTWAKISLLDIFVFFFVVDDINTYLLKRTITPRYSAHKLTEQTSIHTFRFDGKSRLYDEVNNKYLTPKYDWIADIPLYLDHNDSLTVFSNRLNKRGYLNKYTGEVAIEPQYESAWIFSDGLAAVMKDKKIGFINEKNELVIPFRFEHYATEPDDGDYAFHDGYCKMEKDGHLGLIDKKGNWVIEPNCYDIIKYKEGFLVRNENYKEYLINLKMEMVLPTVYDNIYIEDDGYVLVKDNKMWKEDFNGNVIIPFMFEYMNDLAYVAAIDKNGDKTYKVSDRYKSYYVNYLLGIYDIKAQKIITPAKYTEINMLSEDVFEVEVAERGRIIFQP